MAKKKKNKLNLVRILSWGGDALILLGLIVLVVTFREPAQKEIGYTINKTFNVPYTEKVLTPGNKDFWIVIPKIGASSRVIADVNPANQEEYLKALKRGVAHAKGSSYPGEFGNTYVFAHSTDTFYNVGQYNAVFFLLGKLTKGDNIEIYYKDVKYEYIVSEIKIVDPTEVKYLGKLGEWNTLTLQTCYPPGTTLKRLVVVANQKI
jgi:LPXTG-site transpeptidase (sortase) family protein